jgi:hypothetical protein
MLRISTLLPSAVLLCTLAASANAQTPRKRPDVLTEGMTPAQVRATLGEPVRVRREGVLTYMEYPNGRGGGNDYVVIRDCHVVGARFATPSRVVVRATLDTSPVPPDECFASAAEAKAAQGAAAPGGPVAMRDTTPRDTAKAGARPMTPNPPTDVSPGGAMPASGPRMVAEDRPVPSLSTDDWRKRLTLRRPATHLLAVPAASISSPTAFGVEMGEAFVGIAWQSRTRYTHIDDGAAVLGLGLGDRDRAVALEVAATSYSTFRGAGPFETGSLSFKLHHAFGDDWGVAAGIENAVEWGGSDAGFSPYGVVTHVVRLNDEPRRPFSALALSAGLGAGRFRSEQDVVVDKKTVNPFGAVGVQVLEPLSAVADWNGQDLFAGVSVAPVRRVPIVINAGFADITGHAGNGARFILSAGLGFRWLPPFF